MPTSTKTEIYAAIIAIDIVIKALIVCRNFLEARVAPKRRKSKSPVGKLINPHTGKEF